MSDKQKQKILVLGNSGESLDRVLNCLAESPKFRGHKTYRINSLSEIQDLPQVTGFNLCLLVSGLSNKIPDIAYYRECFELFDGPGILGIYTRPGDIPEGIEIQTDGVFDALSVDEISVTVMDAVLRNLLARRKIFKYLKEKVEQLRKLQKIDVLGRLSAGIAHDLNNVLEIIEGNTTLLQRNIGDGPQRKHIDEISKASGEANRLTKQLSAYSKNNKPLPQILDVNETMEEMRSLLERLATDKARLSFGSESNVRNIQIDRSQFGQIIMNLIVNARDAFSDNGKISVRVENAYVNKQYASKYEFMKTGDYVLITVVDNGKGMDSDTLERIFEPFFTTKEKTKGSGLGLSTVYGIVKQYGGYILAKSEINKGTQFKIYFPGISKGAKPEKLVAKESADESVEQFSPKGETILLVEDEDSIRTLLVDTLEMEGFEVLEASGGEEALKISKETKQDIHMLVSDVFMDSLTGPEVARDLLQERPHLHVLYMSGFVRDMEILKKSGQSGYNFIQKPFPLKVFTNKVLSILNGHSEVKTSG